MSGQALAAPFFAAAALLALAGAAKVRRPQPLGRALRTLGLPSASGVVRAFGTLEFGVGVLALVDPAPAAALALAVLYGVFTVFLLWAIVARVPLDSCGCLGERDTPPSVVHVTLDLAAAVVAILVSRTSLESAPLFLAHLSYLAVPFAVGLAAAGYLAYLSVALAPELLSAPAERQAGAETTEERSQPNAG